MKRSIVAAVVLRVVLFFSAVAHASFSADNEYILVFNPGITWKGAQEEVSSWGSSFHLATITSREELKSIERLIHGLDGRFWIGGYQDEANHRLWVSGEPWDDKPRVHQMWAMRETKDHYGPASELRPFLGNRHHRNAWMWMWNDDETPRNISGFIVEHSPGTNGNPGAVPIPGAVWLLGSGLAIFGGLRLVNRAGLRKIL